MGVAVTNSRLGRAKLQARYLYYRHLAPTRGTHRPSGPPPTLADWVAGLATPTRIVVVAAGPTARDVVPEPGALYVATNSSEEVVRDLPYAYFLTEASPVARYTKRGPASASCVGTFFRFETRNVGPHYAELARRTIAFTERRARSAPDIVATNALGHGREQDNFERFEGQVLEWLGQPVRQYNSGFGATYFGYFLAVSFGVPLEIYGIDAGAGGEQHFDGSQMSSPSVVGDRVRTKLAALYELLQAQQHVPVTNRSAYLPFGPPDR